MRGLDDGPDGLNEAAFNRALDGGRKTKAKRRAAPSRTRKVNKVSQVGAVPKETACACGHAVEEHGHDDQYPGSTACSECECVAYEASDPP